MLLVIGSVFSYAAAAEYANENVTEASLDKWDSLILSKDELSVISKDWAGSTLIKVYNAPVLFAFDAYSNIQELLASKYADSCLELNLVIGDMEGVFLKNIICMLIVVCILLSNTVVLGYASSNTEYLDSVAISEDIRENLDVNVTDYVFRIYCIAIRYTFMETDRIQEALSSSNALVEAYAVQKANGTLEFYNTDYDKFGSGGKYQEADGTWVELPFFYIPEKALNALKSMDIAQKIDPSIEVYRVYYLYGKSNHTETAVYYETNCGDYVYYLHYEIGECLFPAKVFSAYQQAIYEESLKIPPGVNGDVLLTGIWDLSAYDINSDSFNLNANPNEGNAEKPDSTGEAGADHNDAVTDDIPSGDNDFDLNASPNEGKVENTGENADDQTASDNAEKPDSTGDAGSDYSNAVTEDAPNSNNWLIYAAAGCVVTVGAVAAILLLRRKKKT